MHDLEAALGYTFQDKRLLQEALTHKTWLKEERDQGRALDGRDQQRLEFLGDAFLGFVVAMELYRRHPDAAEGELTERRVSRVRGAYLAELGRRLGVADHLRLGRGETAQADRNLRILEDAVEALIGAVLIDGGEAEARAVVTRHVLHGLDAAPDRPRNAVSVFNERWQHRFRQSPPQPVYARCGPDHDATWTARIALPDGDVVGEGPSRKAAHRSACASALARWPTA